MGISRQVASLTCSACGKNTMKVGGTTGWKMCDKCQTVFCPSCYRSVLKGSSACTKHSPWGKWLTTKSAPKNGLTEFS
jgi:hypothetical protein